jgi:hypothetical protein
VERTRARDRLPTRGERFVANTPDTRSALSGTLARIPNRRLGPALVYAKSLSNTFSGQQPRSDRLQKSCKSRISHYLSNLFAQEPWNGIINFIRKGKHPRPK